MENQKSEIKNQKGRATESREPNQESQFQTMFSFLISDF